MSNAALLQHMTPVRLTHGAVYLVRYTNSPKVMICRFIRPTPKGYNFLNLVSNKCILKRHMYPHKVTGMFLVNNKLSIKYMQQQFDNVPDGLLDDLRLTLFKKNLILSA